WRWRNAGWLWAPGAHVRCGGRELAFMCPDMAVEERRLARGGGAVGGAGVGDADRRPSGPAGDGRAPVGRPLERADQGGVALAATAAEGGGAEPAAAAAQLVDERHHDAGAGHADRVAEGD